MQRELNLRYRLILSSFGLNSKKGKITETFYKSLGEDFFKGKKVFIVVPKEYGINEIMVREFMRLGMAEEDVYLSNDGYEIHGFDDSKLPEVDIIYLSEARNTYHYQKYLMEHFENYVRDNILAGKTAIAASAGAVCLGYSIYTSCRILFERDETWSLTKPTDTRGLGVLPGSTIVVPHHDAIERKISKKKKTSGEVNSQVLFIYEGELSRYEKVIYVGNDDLLMLDIDDEEGGICISKEIREKIE